MKTIKVALPAAALSSQALAALGMCPRHGTPATTTRWRTFWSPLPIWLFLLVGVLASFFRKKLVGPVPECGQCGHERQRFRFAVGGVWLLVTLLLFVLPAVIPSAAVGFAIWLLLAVAAVLFSFAGEQWRVRGVLTKDQLWLELKGVHPYFAHAVHTQMSAAMQPVQPGY